MWAPVHRNQKIRNPGPSKVEDLRAPVHRNQKIRNPGPSKCEDLGALVHRNQPVWECQSIEISRPSSITKIVYCASYGGSAFACLCLQIGGSHAQLMESPLRYVAILDEYTYFIFFFICCYLTLINKKQYHVLKILHLYKLLFLSLIFSAYYFRKQPMTLSVSLISWNPQHLTAGQLMVRKRR